MWDAGSVPAVRRRARPPVLRPGRAGRRDQPPVRGRPRLRPWQPHRGARAALAGRDGDRRGQLAGDDRRRAGDRGARAAGAEPGVRARRRAGLAAGAARSTCSSATPCCSGCPATTSCCCAGRTCSRPAAGSPSSCQATSTSRATRSSRRWPPPRAGAALLAGAELNRQAGDPADYVALLARPGFEVDAWETSYLHSCTGRTRCSNGRRAPRSGRCSPRSTRSRPPPSSANTGSGCGTRITRNRSVPSFPSAGCSRWCTGTRTLSPSY